MSRVSVIEENGRYYFVNYYKGADMERDGIIKKIGEHTDKREISKENYLKIYNLLSSFEDRPTFDQLPRSQVSYKDNFDLIDKALYQINFVNDYWVTRQEEDEYSTLVLGAINDFSGMELYVFGCFWGTKCGGLMSDGGIYHIDIY